MATSTTSTPMTVIDERVTTVDARRDSSGDAVLLTPVQLEAALGWEVHPDSLCRGDRCVPVAPGQVQRPDGLVDLAAVARALDRPLVVDAAAGLCAIGRPSELRQRVLRDLQVPESLELPDLEGTPRRLSEWRGRKCLLVVVASWCGCGFELPSWQAVQDELGGDGLTVVAVALDDDPARVRPLADGLSLPVLYDPGRLLPEVFAVSNVPTVLWIDESGRVARPPGVAHGSDLFAEFTGILSGPHLDALRRWVRDGTLPLSPSQAADAVADLSDEEVRARLHFRIAAEAHARGDDETTRRHVARAGALAPDDLAVWRAAMPLVGEDPFGPDFLERYESWRERGSPAHALPPIPGP
ncbi:MAG: TlpA family protein disulfide reductase [Acidimicrobiales bacterium]|nr:TlpA family protein disulfide reductase [Acidimicrobiales bacterium]